MAACYDLNPHSIPAPDIRVISPITTANATPYQKQDINRDDMLNSFTRPTIHLVVVQRPEGQRHYDHSTLQCQMTMLVCYCWLRARYYSVLISSAGALTWMPCCTGCGGRE
jgi:hypothetical protein